MKFQKWIIGVWACLVIPLSPTWADKRVEAEYVYSGLTSGLDPWSDLNIRNFFSAGEKNQFMIETDYKNHFNESAAVLGANLTRMYNEAWYQDFSITYGSNTRVLAGWTFFTELHRKLLPQNNLVLGLGAGYVQNANPYEDLYGILDVSYYFESMFSLQGLVRFNQSLPGSVNTLRYIGVLNFMFENKLEAFLRLETGSEGYTVIDVNRFRNQFRSTSETVQVRYWFNETLGMSLFAEFYQNPFYVRNSFGTGLMFNY